MLWMKSELNIRTLVHPISVLAVDIVFKGQIDEIFKCVTFWGFPVGHVADGCFSFGTCSFCECGKYLRCLQVGSG